MWRTYSEKKPRAGQMILVIGRDRGSMPKKTNYFERFQSVAQYRGDGKLILKEPVYPWETQITHWRPLPSYPEDTRWFKFKAWIGRIWDAIW